MNTLDKKKNKNENIKLNINNFINVYNFKLSCCDH